MAARIYIGALLVHHIIILQQAFADAEVVLFHAFLGVFNGFGHHLRLYHLALFQTEGVEHLHHTVAGEDTHQLILKRHIEH